MSNTPKQQNEKPITKAKDKESKVHVYGTSHRTREGHEEQKRNPRQFKRKKVSDPLLFAPPLNKAHQNNPRRV
ncbi:hypothetical protein G7K_4388-t1 [Saitoella complicata NRRL Y-17804]|uniref:Uncharacterized protein n=1 Tax=Saitoella complicata (strain BCRC 22490 / CBS 7301 / JCM 7358 / NBRC 10748 / NRRL Y-17804) TaxID=698492 RepID=A0A0E9NKM2_SAICN|nr:hypothetical protein G7K_4388-t1 [Saitoella complicata NRRL Y-17804]